MASIRKDLLVDASAEHVWDAVRDVGAVHEGDGRCRLVWIIDLLPHALAPTVSALAEQATHVMKKTLEA